MKTIIWIWILLAALSGQSLQAQSVGLMAQFRALGVKKVEATDGTISEYQGSTTVSGNLRLFTKDLFTFRAGLGVTNMRYVVGGDAGGVATNYDAVRRNLTGYLGLEKYFVIGLIEPFVGVYVPITFNAENTFEDNLGNVVEQYENKSIQVGAGVVGGVNLRLLKILRLGVSANVGFERFKEEVIENVNDQPIGVRFKNLEFMPEVGVGVVF